MVEAAIILAGGLGTRLRSVVSDVPKPMAPIGGRPFLAHQLDYWIAQGIKRFVLSVGYKHELVMDYFGRSYHGACIDYAVESTPLGTGGGVLSAVNILGNSASFLLLNGDTYFEVDIKRLVNFAEANDVDWCFSLFNTNDVGRYLGMDVSPQGRIISLQSENIAQHSHLANGGVYWVNQRTLSNWTVLLGSKVSLEDDIFPSELASGRRLFGLEFQGTFIDIGLPEDYYRSMEMLVI